MPVCVGQGQIKNLPGIHPFRVLELDQNPVFFSCFTVVARLGSGKYGLKCVGNLGNRQFHVRGFLPIHDDQFLRAAQFATHLHIGHSADLLNQSLDLAGQEIGHLHIMAANLQLHLLSARASHAEHPQALAGPGSNRCARNTGKLSP